MAEIFRSEAGVCGLRTQGRAARTFGWEMEGSGDASQCVGWSGLDRLEDE